MALPDHLLSTFKVLENEGFRLVQRRPGTKRSIKFEDMSRSLVMDVKLPESNWVRITPSQILQSAKGRKSQKTPAVAEILAIANQELEHQSGNGANAGARDGARKTVGVGVRASAGANANVNANADAATNANANANVNVNPRANGNTIYEDDEEMEDQGNE